MILTKPYNLVLVIALLVACGDNDDEMPATPTPANLDACGNPTTQALNDKRCQFTVSTLTPSFDGSGGLTVDDNDFIYVADFGNSTSNPDGEMVSKIDPNSGEVSVFATGLDGPSGNTFAKNGNLIQANIQGQFISEITPAGEVSTLSSLGLVSPVGVVFDNDDNLYVCNCGATSIQKIEPDGTSSRFVTSALLSCPNGLTIDTDGNFYVANFGNADIIKVTPDGSAELFATLPGGGNSHLVFGNGVIYALSRGGNLLYEVTLTGEVSVIAGTGIDGNIDGSGEIASFFIPNGIGLSKDGTKIYVVSRLVGQGSPSNPVLVRVVKAK